MRDTVFFDFRTTLICLFMFIASHSGTLNSSFVAVPGSASYPTVRSERWKLDKLGNWSGQGAIESALRDPCVVGSTTIPAGDLGPGVHTELCPNCLVEPNNDEYPPGHSVTMDEAGDSPSSLLREYHFTEKGAAHSAEADVAIFTPQPNALKTVLHVSGASQTWRKQYTDPCGNLTFDGEYFYQYDAWNRLVQVNRSGNLTAWRFDRWGMPRHLEVGFIRPSSCGIPAELGALVKHQTYDGVGRLIRTSSPIAAPEGWEFEGDENRGAVPNPWFTRSERFFYDGVRRIQEVVTDPILADGEPRPVQVAVQREIL